MIFVQGSGNSKSAYRDGRWHGNQYPSQWNEAGWWQLSSKKQKHCFCEYERYIHIFEEIFWLVYMYVRNHWRIWKDMHFPDSINSCPMEVHGFCVHAYVQHAKETCPKIVYLFHLYLSYLRDRMVSFSWNWLNSAGW